MRRILPFVEGFLIDKLINSNSIVSNRSKAGIVLLGLAIISVVAALILSVIALYYWLLTRYTVDVAALCAAAMILAVAALFGLIGYTLIQKRRSKLQMMQQDITDKVMQLFESAAEEMELAEHISNHPKTAMALATLTGFVLAERIL